MAGCLTDPEIRMLLSGAMSAWSRDRFQRHLSECESCRARVEAERARGFGESPRSVSPVHDSGASTSDGSHSHDDASIGLLPSIEGYEVLSRIHSGAQGIVFKAVQKSTSRTVAVKLLPHEHAATDRQKHRFEREVGLAASLRHPNIVTVYDSGLTSGRYFFAMEYIHGKPLNEHLASTTMSVPDKLRLFATICSALSYAHQKGVIHRDLKPGNILVDSAGEPHVVDFGLAKSAGVIAMHGDAPFTLTSQFMGTLAYASPEQTKGDPALIDMRSDVYSLGVILFEMLTGTYPYPANTDLVKMFQTICNTPPRAPSSLARDIDADVDTIVLRTLAKEKERRYQSANDLQQDVERWLAGEPIGARRDSLPYLLRIRGRRWMERHPAIAMLTVVALVTLAMYLFWTPVHRLWPWPFDQYERLLMEHFAPATVGVPFEQIRVIAITDETQRQIDAIAAREGFEGVSSAPSNWRSVRRVHGALMERLAAMAPAALVWDIAFPPAESSGERERVAPFNEGFAKGVRAMHAVGVTPVVAIRGWDGSSAPTAGIASEILDSGVELGGGVYRFPEHAPWRVALMIKRGEETFLPGLALVAAVHRLMPDHQMILNFDVRDDALHLPMTSRVIDRQTLLKPTVVTLNVPISHVDPFLPDPRDEPDVDLRPGDVIAWIVVRLPSDDEIKRITLPYHDFFSNDQQRQNELAGEVKGKLMVIGDLRSASTNDVQQAPDGRIISGLFAHVAAMDAVLRGAVVMRFPRGLSYVAVLAIGGLIGVGLVRCLRGRWRVGAIALLAGAAAMTIISVVIYHQTGYLCNPMFPISTMLLSYIAATELIATRRVRISHSSSVGGHSYEPT